MRNTLLLLLLFSSSQFLYATHNRAGEIVYEQIGDQTIQATIITYSKTSSTPADRDSLTICWGDGSCETLVRVNGNGAGEPQENDFKVNTYVGTHAYDAMGTYQISMTDPNRNGGILNVNSANSDLVQFHLQATVNLMSMENDQTNRSPTLLVPPIDIGFVRQPFMHTPNAVDLDGDSIAYELITPLMENDMPVPNYVQVDEIGAGADNTYTFDEKTGLFVWNSPQIVGEYNIAIKVKAYRDGQLVDMLVRDMQILIMPDDNKPPALSIQDFIPTTIKIDAGETVNINFIGIDEEDRIVDGIPDLSVTSETIELGASTEYNSTLGSSTGKFTWTPSESDVRSTPYQVTIKAVDSKSAASFVVVNIEVSAFSTAISETFKNEGYKLFPNPTRGESFLQIPDKGINQSATLSIFDNLGRLVQTQEIDQLTKTISLPTTELTQGNYIIQLRNQEINVSSSLIIH